MRSDIIPVRRETSKRQISSPAMLDAVRGEKRDEGHHPSRTAEI